MDFNSIFNRAPTGRLEGSLEGNRTDDMVFAYWADYLDEIAPQGRTEFAVKKAEGTYRRLVERLKTDEAEIRSAQGVYKQTHKLDKHQTEELIKELENFVRSRSAPRTVFPSIEVQDRERRALEHFLDDEVSATYNLLLFDFFQDIYEAEEAFRYSRIAATPPRLRTPMQEAVFEKQSQKIADAYHRFNNDYPKAKARYEALKVDVKSKVQAHLHRLIDKVVELFVYDPYELGILYVRRHHPGAIGTLQGLEEQEE